MQIGQFVVHRVSAHKTSRTVTLEGEQATADVDVLEVELSEPDGQHGSLTLRFFSAADRSAALSEFREGETVTLTTGA